MGEVRKALGETARAPRCIATMHRRGYRFVAPVTRLDVSSGVAAAARDLAGPLLRAHAPALSLQMAWASSTAGHEARPHERLADMQARMLREMAASIEALTVEMPLLLVLEDLHWSDYATLDLVAWLARRQEPA